MNGLTLLVMIALAIGIVIAYRAGILRGKRDARTISQAPLRPAVPLAAPAPVVEPPSATTIATPPASGSGEELARLVRSLEAETAALRRAARTQDAERAQLADLAEDRRRLLRDVAHARGETARYRQLVVDLENNALPPLLDGNTVDDLKLIVGIGPMLERMLHQLGITTYRQIARWSERDIDDFDARLPEFPGRIRRDAWVTQARALHQAKFGATPPAPHR